jgi:hypothetical protein
MSRFVLPAASKRSTCTSRAEQPDRLGRSGAYLMRDARQGRLGVQLLEQSSRVLESPCARRTAPLACEDVADRSATSHAWATADNSAPSGRPSSRVARGPRVPAESRGRQLRTGRYDSPQDLCSNDFRARASDRTPKRDASCGRPSRGESRYLRRNSPSSGFMIKSVT